MRIALFLHHWTNNPEKRSRRKYQTKTLFQRCSSVVNVWTTLSTSKQRLAVRFQNFDKLCSKESFYQVSSIFCRIKSACMKNPFKEQYCFKSGYSMDSFAFYFYLLKREIIKIKTTNCLKLHVSKCRFQKIIGGKITLFRLKKSTREVIVTQISCHWTMIIGPFFRPTLLFCFAELNHFFQKSISLISYTKSWCLMQLLNWVRRESKKHGSLCRFKSKASNKTIPHIKLN